MTGLNAEVIAVVGLLLLAGGLVLRWRTARYSR
jgi:LPXTG-motif cell wall-anchored protein